MIEILNGLTETINYGSGLGLRLFHNTDFEDYPNHWHVGIEILMPLRSVYTVCVGKEQYRLREGDILILNTGTVHSLEAPPEGERIILQFDPSLLYMMKDMETLLVLMPDVFCIVKEDPVYPGVREQMNRLLEEYDGGTMFCEAVMYAALIEMFVEIGRAVTARRTDGPGGAKRGRADKQTEYLEIIMKACSYINQHFQEKLRLEDVAAAVGFSKFHFTRIFKQYMNMTFSEYLNRKRVECAEGLLYSTEMSVTDVAMNSGFSSMSAFDRTFKLASGRSPSEFRSMVRQQRQTVKTEQ